MAYDTPAPLPFRTIRKSNHLFFSGDSCHPMLPYLAQGANSAMEDGAVLGRLLGSINDASQVPSILQAYEEIRKTRVEKIATQALKQVSLFFFSFIEGTCMLTMMVRE